VRLAGGEVVPCDLALVGVGVLPNLELAQAAGLVCGNGIVVDAQARTSHPDIYAIGDVAWRPLVHYGREGRLESVHNAIEGGKIAAASILGAAPPALEAPWFWSDQFDLKLQTAGLWTGADQRILRGDPQSRSFAVFYLKEGRLLAVDAVNAPPEYIVGKKLAAASARVAPGELADKSVSMKDISVRALK
jgi:3-phenylpropionate/trans-cinnamate dioxygenase ferredoxin reductase subunit